MTTKNKKIKDVLKQLYTDGIIRAIDYHFSLFLFDIHPDPLLALAGALVSFETASGNTCVDLRNYTTGNNRSVSKTLFNLPHVVHKKIMRMIQVPFSNWPCYLIDSPAVSRGEDPAPLVVDQHRLYLHRHWVHEVFILRWLKKQRSGLDIDKTVCKKWLDNLFPQDNGNEINWQKVAAATAVLTTFSVISGGPGTGKTTTVIRLLVLLTALALERGKATPVIRLAAPTGKAAARLSESIGVAIKALECPESIKALIPRQAQTIHRLLGTYSGSKHFIYNVANPLHMDVLVVDEASMIDQTLMARLLEAFPEKGRLILLGDKDQLASVEAGSVLGGLCQFSNMPFGPAMRSALESVTGYTLPQQDEHSDENPLAKKDSFYINNHLCLLKKSYRFRDDSGIACLAKAVNQGAIDQVERLSSRAFSDFTLHTNADYPELLPEIVIKGYAPFLKAIKEGESDKHIHNIFGQFQILAAIKEGTRGVEGLNQMTKSLLHSRSSSTLWYPGRPVMITRNDPALSLSNGDIGITIKDVDNQLRVVFVMPDSQKRKIIPVRLLACETAYTMTVHKSQGSEFDHVILVLPDYNTPVLTRELLYTAITRARKRLDIFGSLEIIKSAIRHKTSRVSGLTDSLKA